MQDEMFMKKAIELSKLAVEHGNEPFGAVLVKNGEIVFRIISGNPRQFNYRDESAGVCVSAQKI